MGKLSRLLLALMLIWAPLLLGSNRAIFWSLNGSVGAIAILCFLAAEWKTHRVSVSSWNLPFQLLLLLMLPAIWMLMQIMPGVALSLQHPVWAEVPTASGRITINPHQTQIAIMWWLTLSVVFIAVRAGTKRGSAEVFMNLMLFVILAVAVFGLANMYFGWETIGIQPKTAYPGWLTSTFVNRNTAASFFAIGMVIATTLALREYQTIRERLSGNSRLAWAFLVLSSRVSIYLGLASAIFTALLLTGSRAGIASSLLGTFLVIFLAPRQRRRSSVFFPIALIAGLSLIAISANALLERAHGAPGSSSVRIDLYREAINAILDRPIVGHGGGTYQSVEPLYHLPETPTDLIWNHAHSSYLEAAVGLGLPITLTWLALAGALWFQLHRAIKRAQGLMPATVATVAIFVAEGLHALVDFSLQVQAIALYLACLMGLAVGEVMATAGSGSGGSGRAERTNDPFSLEPKKMNRKVLFWTIYLSFTVAILSVATDYVFFVFYKSRLDGLQKPSSAVQTVPYVSPVTLGRLGTVSTEKRSSFINYLPTKPKGKIRIGAFGDSFTFGDEVDENSDFPQLLSDLIAKMGVKKVEILNFGNSWHGFGQSFIMWDEVGRQFDLDYILLGPETFFANRDMRFNHTDGSSPYYLHSRFVIEDDKLERVDIPGATFTEKFDYYNSFFPAWRVLRYDRNDPPFLAALLPQGRTLGNPFYYSNQSEAAEAGEIYSRLIKLMKKGGKPIVTSFFDPKFADVGRHLNETADSLLCVAGLNQVTTFPYLAPQGHNSRAGNGLLAKNYLALLVGRPVDSLLISTSDLEDDRPAIPAPSADLSSYDEIGFRLNEVETGVFTSLSGVVQRPSFFKDKQAKSMIALKQPGNSMLDGAFLIGPKTLDDKAVARLVYRSSQGDVEADLGAVLRPVDGLGIGVIAFPEFEFSYRQPFISISSDSLFTYIQREVGGGTLELFIGDHVTLKGYYDAGTKAFKLRPLEGDMYMLRSNSSDDPALDRGQLSGYVYAILRSGENSPSIPIAQWKLINERLAPQAACPHSWTAPLASISVEPNPNSKIDLILSGDDYQGPPQARVYIDGLLVESILIGAIHQRGEKQNLTISLNGLAKPKTLRIQFVNDAYNPDTGEDRNLWVEAVTVNGRAYSVEDAVYRRNDGEAAAPQSQMAWEGSLIFSLDMP